MITAHKIKLAKEFEQGMYFSCHMCGECCRGLREGEVYLYKNDIIRLAHHLRLKGTRGLKKFSLKYLKIVKSTFYWRAPGAKKEKKYELDELGFRFTGDDEHCHFLIDNKCSVHEARPFQCRAFPIGWNMLISNVSQVRDYSKKCPALRDSLENKGDTFYSKDELLQWSQEEYEIEKAYFLEMKEHNFNIFKVYPFLPKNITC